jgi:type VI protein secretion system component Hcp
MADKESNDVLMTFIDSTGRGVAAECTSKWDKNDIDMMEGFQDGKFFEVDDFDFGVSLDDSEDSGPDSDRSSSSGNLPENSLHAPPGGDGATTPQNAEKKKTSSSKKFAKYIEGGSIEFKCKPEIKEVTITRQVDISSVRFFQSCLHYGKFKRAILVKRKFTGRYDFHEAFLRLEFKEPLITGIDWDEGDIIKEKLKFICRGIAAAYKPQKHDGTLEAAKQTDWSYLDLADQNKNAQKKK